MRAYAFVLAIVSVVATALPTASSGPPNDGRGATIFTAPELQGTSTAIPANTWCTDLNNIFGNFDGQVRGMIVEKGMRCQFHINYACPTQGWKYEFGSKDQALAVGTLPEWLDQKIHSIYCTQT